MAEPQIIEVTFAPDPNYYVGIPQRQTDDLPLHVKTREDAPKNAAYWYEYDEPEDQWRNGYYCLIPDNTGDAPRRVEFLKANGRYNWYILRDRKSVV